MYIVYEQQTSYSEFIYFALDEIAHNLVVEVFYRSPLDALLHILLLQDMEKKSSALENKASVEIKQKWIEGGKRRRVWRNITCSAFRVSSMNICWSFSFTKLMQNCSNPFF